MKIGGVRHSVTRRELRREKEQQAARDALSLGREPGTLPIVPAKSRTGRNVPPPVLLPPNEVLDRRKRDPLPLPDQEVLLEYCLRLRHQVEIILEPEVWGDEIRVRRSVIEDFDPEGRLLLTQTLPPVLTAHIGQVAELSFLGRYFDLPGGRWIRVGYQTPILELIKDFQISMRARETVIVVDPPTNLKPVTVRTAYRLVPPSDLDLRLVTWPDGTELGLMDISLGGAQFHHPVRWGIRTMYRMDLALMSGQLTLRMQGRVVRTGRVRDRYGVERGLASVRFMDMDSETRDRLSRLLASVYRHLLARRSGVLDQEE